jgi:hypothetical protein
VRHVGRGRSEFFFRSGHSRKFPWAVGRVYARHPVCTRSGGRKARPACCPIKTEPRTSNGEAPLPVRGLWCVCVWLAAGRFYTCRCSRAPQGAVRTLRHAATNGGHKARPTVPVAFTCGPARKRQRRLS